MKILPVLLVAVTALIACPAFADDVRIAYLVDAKELRKGTIATTSLTFGVFEDVSCVTPVSSTVIDAGSVDLIEKVKALRLKGGAKAPSVARIEHVMDVDAEGALYVEITGAGIVPVGESCQAQGPPGATGTDGPPGSNGPEGPPGDSADFGSCVVRSSGFLPPGPPVLVACLVGETVTGGGCRIAASSGLQQSRPRDDGTEGWMCDTTNVDVEAYAVCCQ